MHNDDIRGVACQQQVLTRSCRPCRCERGRTPGCWRGLSSSGAGWNTWASGYASGSPAGGDRARFHTVMMTNMLHFCQTLVCVCVFERRKLSQPYQAILCLCVFVHCVYTNLQQSVWCYLHHHSIIRHQAEALLEEDRADQVITMVIC